MPTALGATTAESHADRPLASPLRHYQQHAPTVVQREHARQGQHQRARRVRSVARGRRRCCQGGRSCQSRLACHCSCAHTDAIVAAVEAVDEPTASTKGVA